MEQASLDRSDTIIALGFTNHNEALSYLAQQQVFKEADIQYKGNKNELIARSRIKPLYDKIFGGSKYVYFKDYVTNDTINVPVEVKRYPFGERYIQTFYSLLYALKDPTYLVIYKL